MCVFSERRNKFIPICSLGGGFGKAELDEINNNLKATSQLSAKVAEFPLNMKATQYLKLNQVWEVAFDSFSESSNYRVGYEELGRGLSLRFPRFYRLRPDKQVHECSTEEQILEMVGNSKI